jgi:hypothetical protein
MMVNDEVVGVEVPPSIEKNVETSTANDKKGDKGSSKATTPKVPQVDDLSEELNRLKILCKIDRLKKKLKVKKIQESASSSSSCESDASSDEEVTKKKRKNKGAKQSYNSVSFNYNSLPSNNPFMSVPIGKAPHFDRTNYTQWKHSMKIYLYSLNWGVWQVICDGVDFSEDGEEPDFKQLQQIHHNVQATFILLSS